ncbi:MAG TPA: MarR family transcriptional regulator [Candidatus Paceibacterota bacterium]
MNDLKKAEKIFKGVAHKNRLAVLLLLKNRPELSVIEISEVLKIELKNTAQHVAKLEASGLVMKRHDGNFVRLALTRRGKSILEFYRILE